MEVSKISTNYYVSFPKKEIILGADLRWKNFADLRDGKPNPVLFSAEANVALNVSQWFSQNGITAASYPQTAILNTVQQKIGEKPVLLGDVITEKMMKTYVQDGTYPKELIRRPLSRNEKTHFMDVVTCGGVWGYAGTGESGDSGMQYLIVDTKSQMVLSNSLKWIPIKDIRRNPEMARNILTCCGSAEWIQSLVAWFRKSGMHISPYARKTADAKFSCNLDAMEANSFERLVREGAIPRKLNRKANDAIEIKVFQTELERMTAAPKPITTPSQNTPQPAPTDTPTGEQASEKNDKGISLIAQSSSVSELINEMIKTADDFKNLLEKSSGILHEKMEALKDAEKEVTDMYHMIEFCNLNAADGFSIYKALQKILKKRRVLKDEIFALDLVVGRLKSGATIDNIDSFIKSVEGLSSRQYRLRTCSMEQIQKIIHSEKTLASICGVG